MASNLNYKQVANVSRRTWDVETYDQRAKERQAREDTEHQNEVPSQKVTDKIDHDNSNKEEFQAAPAGAAGPDGSKRAFLRARKEAVDLESKVGTSEMVSSDNAVVKTGIGWHCKVCDCFLKDSHTYLDHINGKKHQRKLGFSMRVERSTKDQVLERLKAITQTTEQSESNASDVLDFDELVKSKDEALQREREEKKRKRKERKELEKRKQEQDDDEDAEDEEVEVEGIDPAMAAMMGFSGFGGGKKN